MYKHFHLQKWRLKWFLNSTQLHFLCLFCSRFLIGSLKPQLQSSSGLASTLSLAVFLSFGLFRFRLLPFSRAAARQPAHHHLTASCGFDLLKNQEEKSVCWGKEVLEIQISLDVLQDIKSVWCKHVSQERWSMYFFFFWWDQKEVSHYFVGSRSLWYCFKNFLQMSQDLSPSSVALISLQALVLHELLHQRGVAWMEKVHDRRRLLQ